MTTPNNPNGPDEYELPPTPPDVSDDYVLPLPQRHKQPLGDDNTLPGPWETPNMEAWDRLQNAYDAPAPPISHTKRNRIVASIAGVGLVASGIGAAVGIFGGDSKPKHTATKTVSEVPAFEPDITTGSAIVDADLHKAINRDECSTEVSYNDVAGIYRRLFGPTDLHTLSPAELRANAFNLASKVSETRNGLGLVESPLNLQELNDDSLGGQTIQLKTYQETLADYLANFGISVRYNWDWKEKDTPSVLADPVPAKELENNRAIRPVITAILNNFANFPPSIVREAGVKRIIIGDIIHKNALGETMASSDDLFFDIQNLNDGSARYFSYNLSNAAVAPAHELAHKIDNATCLGVLARYTDDKAFLSFNDGFTYGEHASKQLEMKNRSQGFSVLNTPGEAIVARYYGGQDPREDKATILGEKVMNVTSAAALYPETGGATIVQEKVALLLARVVKKIPIAGEYYILSVEAGRLRAEVERRIRAASDAAVNDHKDIYEAIKPYQAILEPLARAFNENTELVTRD